MGRRIGCVYWYACLIKMRDRYGATLPFFNGMLPKYGIMEGFYSFPDGSHGGMQDGSLVVELARFCSLFSLLIIPLILFVLMSSTSITFTRKRSIDVLLVLFVHSWCFFSEINDGAFVFFLLVFATLLFHNCIFIFILFTAMVAKV